MNQEWAVYIQHEEGEHIRYSRWMSREGAERLLNSLIADADEHGEPHPYLVPREAGGAA